MSYMKKEELRSKLLELLMEHPDANIIGSVDEEVVTGEYSGYLASIYRVDYVEYAIWQNHYYDDEDELIYDWLEQNYIDYQDKTEEEQKLLAKEDTEKLWKNAIMIHCVPFCEVD